MPVLLIGELTLDLIKKALTETCTQAEITDLFGRHGIDLGPTPDFSNKLGHISSYLDHQDWSDRTMVRQLLDALSKIVGLPFPSGRPPQSVKEMLLQLEEDGYKWTGKEFVKIEHVMEEGGAKPLREYRPEPAQPEAEKPKTETPTYSDDPITAAKRLIESTCKTILTAHGEKVQGSEEVTSLTRRTVKLLGFLPGEVSEKSKGTDVTRKVFQSIGALLQGLAEFLSLYSDPSKKKPGTMEAHHAKLVVGLAGMLAMLLMDTHEHTQKTK